MTGPGEQDKSASSSLSSLATASTNTLPPFPRRQCFCTNPTVTSDLRAKLNRRRDHRDNDGENQSSVRRKGGASSPSKFLDRHDDKTRLDSSFVHLPRPSSRSTQPSSSPHPTSLSSSSYLFCPGGNVRNEGTSRMDGNGDGSSVLNVVRHASVLLGVAAGDNRRTDIDADGNGVEGDGKYNDVSLCPHCVERVAHALEEDTERLQNECESYLNAVREEEERLETLRKTILAANSGFITANDDGGGETSGSPDDDQVIESTIESFREEIAVLSAACNEHEQELRHLNNLLEEQTHRAENLGLEEERLYLDMNSLEIDAGAFDSMNRQLALQCRDVQREVSALSRVQLHTVLFDLVVDERGLRYPLINDLRLAYRPKGDLTWEEINTAWSQAAQLLMFVAGAVKFASRDLRIVSLASCAKIISVAASGKTKVVYSLGKDFEDKKTSRMNSSKEEYSMASSLRAFHALLEQMFQHVSALSSAGGIRPTSVFPPPFEMSMHRIGTTDLSILQEGDDSSWSVVVHRMASNLKWLSDNATRFTAIADSYSTPFSARVSSN